MPKIKMEEIAKAMPLVVALQTHFPPGRNGRPRHITTAVRWITRGVGPKRIKLAGWKSGAGWVVTKQACLEFLEKLNSDLSEPDEAQRTAETENEGRRVGETSRALESLGC